MSEVQESQNPTRGLKAYLHFILPSSLGALLFLTPIQVGDRVTIGMGLIAEAVQSMAAGWLPGFTTFILGLSALIACVALGVKPAWARQASPWSSIFAPSGVWLGLRVLGFGFAVMTLFQFGPEWVWHNSTGGVMLNDLAPVLVTFFFFAALLLPLLVEFGLMEFIGALARDVFRWLFRLPGRASIDAVASWLGSGTVGVLITTQQYESGYYTQREAAVIATNFSVASIAFCLLISNVIGLNHLFIPFYLTVVVTGLIAAVITPRLPPLAWKRDVYEASVGKRISEDRPKDCRALTWAIDQALARAAKAPSKQVLIERSLFNIADIWFGLLPLVMAIGTLALALAEYTPLFTWLSYPLVPLLELLQLPEAEAAAPALVVGFADMFLPAVLGQSIESELTRFVIASMSLTQLIYMSEVGVLLMKSKIPLNLIELAAIFALRTLITLPLVTFIAHVVVF